jgi:hypothetical protein
VWLIPPASFQPGIFLAVVALIAIGLRYKAGWGWLLVLWLVSNVLLTGEWVIYIYQVSPLSPQETHSAALSFALTAGVIFLAGSGIVVWLVALIFPLRTAPKEVPPTGPPGEPEDTHELRGLPQRYEALLETYRKARQQAEHPPWYRAMFRVYVPSYAREDFTSALRTLDFFRTDFLASAPVLTALSAMPTARLSALEAYQRVNLKRLRQRLLPVRPLFSALPPVLVAASRLVPSGTTSVPNWDAARASVLTFVAQPEHWSLVMGISAFVLGWILGTITVWWKQRRLEAFGELLTVALAQRRMEAFGDTDSGGGSRLGGRFDR